MTKEEKAKILLKAVDEQYMIPAYREKDVLFSFVNGLKRIEEIEKRENKSCKNQ